MSNLLEDLENIFVYLDDILIVTETEDKHIVLLKMMLDSLEKGETTINGKKCEIFV